MDSFVQIPLIILPKVSCFIIVEPANAETFILSFYEKTTNDIPISSLKLSNYNAQNNPQTGSFESQPVNGKQLETTIKNTVNQKNQNQKANPEHNFITSVEKPYTCAQCGKKFMHERNCKIHQRIHGDEAFVCSYCGKKFATKSNLTIHIRVHTQEAPYGCDVCGRKFKQQHSLKEHQRIHTQEKPYKCPCCYRPFRLLHDMKAHFRIHTGEKPFVCNICNRSFAQRSTLKVHQKKLHPLCPS